MARKLEVVGVVDEREGGTGEGDRGRGKVQTKEHRPSVTPLIYKCFCVCRICTLTITIIVILRYSYCILINTPSAHMVHINLNILYTRVEHSPIENTVYSKYFMGNTDNTHCNEFKRA